MKLITDDVKEGWLRLFPLSITPQYEGKQRQN